MLDCKQTSHLIIAVKGGIYIVKIKELEEKSGITRANIRFYEKEGLINPNRNENSYRDYSEEDLKALNRIIVLRKLDIPVTDIKKIFEGTISLEEAVRKQKDVLSREIESLQGALDICEQMVKEQIDIQSFDEVRYLEMIGQKEKRGRSFKDIADDYMAFELDIFSSMWKSVFFLDFNGQRKIYGIKWALAIVLIICIVRGLVKQFIWHSGTFVEGFLYPFIIFAIVSAILLPVYILNKSHHKAASILMSVIVSVSVIFLASVLILLIVLIFNSWLHFLF